MIPVDDYDGHPSTRDYDDKDHKDYFPPRETRALDEYEQLARDGVPECQICGIWGHHTQRCPEGRYMRTITTHEDPWRTE